MLPDQMLKSQVFIVETEVTIGAPSITGKDANKVQKEVFGDMEFPVTKLVTNLSGRPLLTPACILEEGVKEHEVKFNKLSEFTRFFSDIEALAELNHWKEAVVISAPYTDEDKSPSNVVDFQALKTAYENGPDELTKDQLVELANSFGIKTRSTNTESWLREKIDEALTAPSDDSGSKE